MKKWMVVPVIALACVGFGFTAQATAKAKAGAAKAVEAKPQKSRGQADKAAKPEENDPNAKLPAPAEKGGEKSRGGTCRLVVDNWTQYNVHRIFVSDQDVGSVTKYGKAEGYYPAGKYTVRAEADFTNGDTWTWGPATLDCQGTQTWKLTE